MYDDQVRYDLITWDPRTWVDAVGSPAVPVTYNYQVPIKTTTASQTIQLNCVTIDPQNPSVIYVGYSKYLKAAPSNFENGYFKFTNARTSGEYMGQYYVSATGDLPSIASAPELGAAPYLPVPPNAKGTLPFLAPGMSGYRVTLAGNGIPLSMAVDPNTPTTLWVGKDDGVLRSTNDGTTYSSLNTYTNVRKILIDPINTVNVYIGTENGLYRSNNAGSTWKQIKSGLEGHTTINGFGLSPGGWGNRRIFSGTTAGVYMGVTTLDF